MAVNYYDQFQPLTYNPMTLQEMLIGPQMMQQRHDQAQALLDQEALFDVPTLAVDKPGVQEWMNKYKENINSLSDQLLETGYNKELSRRARQILQEKQEATSSRGLLGKAGYAYQQYLKNIEDERKRLDKGEITRDQFDRGIQLALQAYNEAGGANQDASYSPWYSTKAIDLQDLASKYGKEITPQTIAKDLGYSIDENGVIRDSNRKTVTITPERIASVISQRLMSNPEALAYMQERARLGLSNGVLDDINRIALGAAETFYRNDIETKSGYDYGLFKKYQEGFFNDRTLSQDAAAEILSLDTIPIENLVDLAKNGKPKYKYTDTKINQKMPDPMTSLVFGEVSRPELINKEESDLIKQHANQQIDNNLNFYHSNGQTNISREDILNWEDNWAKNNKTTAAFNFVPEAKYENSYKQDIKKLENGSFPGSIDEWIIDGKQLKESDDWQKAIGYEYKDNKVTHVTTGYAGNGMMAAKITMANGKTYTAIRKPSTSDQSKFATANTLFNHFYDNSRGEIELTNPTDNSPIIMNKIITPDGLKATVTLTEPVIVNGKIVAYRPQKDYNSIDYNQAIQNLTHLVLRDKYVQTDQNQKPSHGER